MPGIATVTPHNCNGYLRAAVREGGRVEASMPHACRLSMHMHVQSGAAWCTPVGAPAGGVKDIAML
jgi:hypothetical protein